MEIIDKGHSYELNDLDAQSYHTKPLLIFVKREGEGYPGNVGHHPGTTMQECLRACIDRAKYVNNQIFSDLTEMGIKHMRLAILDFETRAALRHNRKLVNVREDIENEPTCIACGHIQCNNI